MSTAEKDDVAIALMLSIEEYENAGITMKPLPIDESDDWNLFLCFILI